VCQGRTVCAWVRCAGQHVEDEKHVMFECYWYYDIRERFKRLYRGTGGPTNPACMQRLLNFPNQAAVAQLVHLIDERHQGRLVIRSGMICKMRSGSAVGSDSSLVVCSLFALSLSAQ
jgi:hypothetical protein